VANVRQWRKVIKMARRERDEAGIYAGILKR
jgi:hypothetical protein